MIAAAAAAAADAAAAAADAAAAAAAEAEAAAEAAALRADEAEQAPLDTTAATAAASAPAIATVDEIQQAPLQAPAAAAAPDVVALPSAAAAGGTHEQLIAVIGNAVQVIQRAATAWQPGMAFPPDWPLTLPVRSWEKAALTSNYSIRAILPGYSSAADMPLRNEMDAFDQWSMAKVELSRQRGYVKPVRAATQLNAGETVERFMGYCFKHEAVPARQLGFGLLERPQVVAGFIAFLVRRKVNAETIQHNIAHLRKALTFKQSGSQVGAV
jgi:hypothetical protein